MVYILHEQKFANNNDLNGNYKQYNNIFNHSNNNKAF